MLILGIDTATTQVGVAVGTGDRILASFHESKDRRHAETTVPAIKDVCAQAQVSLAEIDAVAVDVGPGLFTGLRVGLATAKAIAQACDIPMLGLTSLEVLAFSTRDSDRTVMATVDARREEIFYALYSGASEVHRTTDAGNATGAGSAMACLEEPQVAKPADVVERLTGFSSTSIPSNSSAGLLVVGDGAQRYRELFEAVPGLELRPPLYPSAADLVELAHIRAQQDGFESPAAIVPQYLRAPDARINWEQRVRA